MNLQNKTILITGGTSGIGFATAELLAQQGNNVIITGRDRSKLEKAGNALGVHTIAFDVTKEEDLIALLSRVESAYPQLSILINNAGSGKIYKLGEGAGSFDAAKEEFETNYFGPVRLTEALLPVLKRQPEAAVVNIISNVAIHPLIIMPSYSDSKAALHSHSTALRLTLSSDTAIKVFEVFPSLVSTEGTKEMGLPDGLPASVAARTILKGIENNQNEIYVGEAGQQRDAYLADPQAATASFNKGLY